MFAILACASSGCLVVSVHPFYDDAQVLTDEAIVGSWVDPDEGGTTITIEPGEWNSYQIDLIDRTGTQRYTGHVTKVGEREYVDVTPAHGFERGELFVPLHLAFLVETSTDSLTIRELNYEWFRRAQHAGRLAAVSAMLDEKQNVLFTAATGSIRAFLRRQQRVEAIFGAGTTLVRKHD